MVNCVLEITQASPICPSGKGKMQVKVSVEHFGMGVTG
jgi:hypothetical protein